MSAGLMKPKYNTNNLPYTQHSPCSGIDHRFFTYFGAVCWSWNTADKTCMHCILFRLVLLSQRPQRSLEVNVWKLMLILLLQYNTITEHYECHITTAMICHTCAFDGNDCVFPVFFAKTVFVLYLRSVQVIPVITYCARFLAYPHVSGATLIQFVCIKSINSIFTVSSFLLLFYFAVCHICGWRKQPRTK